jgi:hypothetical protein
LDLGGSQGDADAVDRSRLLGSGLRERGKTM